MTSRYALAVLILTWVPGAGATAQGLRVFQRHGLAIRIDVRSAEQLEAFYGARGFAPAGIRALRSACFITTRVHNRSATVVWLEPSRWIIRDAEGAPVRRLDRAAWAQRFDAVQLPPAQRATFGWTLLPERRALQPHEPVGGNLTVVPPAGEFSVELRFRTGRAGKGRALRVRVPRLRCPAEVS